MQTDRKTGGGSVVKTYRHPLLQSISRYLSALDGLADPKAKRDVKWTPQAAAIAAVLMALSAERALTDRFHDALASMAVDYRGTEQTGLTYNGLLKALERQWQVVLPMLKSALQEHVRQALKKVVRTEGWTLGVNAIAAKRKDPRRISPAQLARVVRRSMHRDIHPRRSTTAKMQDQFATSVRDNYQRRRPKASRHRAITTNTPQLILKPPKIRVANRDERWLAKRQHRASRIT